MYMYICVCLSSEVIVGVNKYKLAKEEPLEVRSIDNSEVLEIQVQSILQHVLLYMYIPFYSTTSNEVYVHLRTLYVRTETVTHVCIIYYTQEKEKQCHNIQKYSSIMYAVHILFCLCNIYMYV